MATSHATPCITPRPSKSETALRPQARAAGTTSSGFPNPSPTKSHWLFRTQRTLAHAGAGWEHVIHVNSYHVGGFPPEVNEQMVKWYRHYMPNHTPIWTELGVEALGLPAMRIEIRVTAIIA